MAEPRYLSGDEYALTGGYEDLINCLVCSKEYDRVEYRSNTCSECEDKIIKREREQVSNVGQCEGCKMNALLVDGVLCEVCDE